MVLLALVVGLVRLPETERGGAQPVRRGRIGAVGARHDIGPAGHQPGSREGVVESGRASPASPSRPIAVPAGSCSSNGRRVPADPVELLPAAQRDRSPREPRSSRTSSTWAGSSSRRSCSRTGSGTPPTSRPALIARPLAFSIAGPIAGYPTVKVGEPCQRGGGGRDRGVDGDARHDRRWGPSAFIVDALALSGIGNGVSAPACGHSPTRWTTGPRRGSAVQQMIAQVGSVAGSRSCRRCRGLAEGRRARWASLATPTTSVRWRAVAPWHSPSWSAHGAAPRRWRPRSLDPATPSSP